MNSFLANPSYYIGRVSLVLLALIILSVPIILFLRNKTRGSSLIWHLYIVYNIFYKKVMIVMSVLAVTSITLAIIEFKESLFIDTIIKTANNIIQSEIMLGAFLASIFGIIAHCIQRKSDNRKEIRKYSKLLHSELEFLLWEFRSLYYGLSLISEGDNDKKKDYLSKKKQLIYVNNWRDYCTVISDEINVHDIFRLFRNAETYNQAVVDKDYDLILHTISLVISWDNVDRVMGGMMGSNEDLLNDLKAMTHNKRFKKKWFKSFVKELIAHKNNKRLEKSHELNSLTSTINESDCRFSDSDIERLVMDWFEKQPKSFRSKYEKLINQIIHESQLVYKGAKTIRQVCSLNKEEQK